MRYVNPFAAAPLHLAMRDLVQPMWQEGDRLVVDQTHTTHPRQIWTYTYDLADSRLTLKPETATPCDSACLSAMAQDLGQHANVWTLFTNPEGNLQGRLQRALADAGYVLCRSIDYRQQEALILTHLARSEANCARQEPTSETATMIQAQTTSPASFLAGRANRATQRS